ncbi:peroxide stress protein YaaA [Frigoriflavimonas asaccharolytica]|uniref:UPF0246 protein HNQ03_001936 n=1 Tax=Frigoriflavimonas asaccharolytica TaxID=2735899 RepID=A0A8J8G8X1_9FLAO|nr:peroxide stress protein YaaA [Frigoriflavimonas asaccharolytica]NRS92855.1 hypothetical protein [Frigoriflavimonas asaccharolytica]
MKILSSPAKLMSVDNNPKLPKFSTPKFINEATLIQKYLKEKSPDYLKNLMDISTKLADENWERNQNWNAKPNAKESTAALFAFKGEVYRGLDAQSLDDKALGYLQDNFRMLSGLYGMLKPSDKIMLYRLEMGRNFEFEANKNLYDFWREMLTENFNKELKKNELILNLASAEYYKVLDEKKLKGKVINFHFYELKSGKPKQIVVYTKHARGLVIKYCAENNCENLDDVKSFNYENYQFAEDLSTENCLVFTR